MTLNFNDYDTIRIICIDMYVYNVPLCDYNLFIPIYYNDFNDSL